MTNTLVETEHSGTLARWAGRGRISQDAFFLRGGAQVWRLRGVRTGLCSCPGPCSCLPPARLSQVLPVRFPRLAPRRAAPSR